MSYDIDTRVIPNFLSDNEIAEILDQIIACRINTWRDTSPEHDAKLELFVRDDVYTRAMLQLEPKSRIEEIIRPKLDLHFGKELSVATGHILTSLTPYGIHTDARDGHGISDEREAAWTLLIPLDNYDSSTILFDQVAPEGEGIPRSCIEKYNWPKLNKITKEERELYLGNQTEELLSYFSIEKIYKWKKGECFAASRRKFHSSDYFHQRRVSFKKAIILWTTLPRK